MIQDTAQKISVVAIGASAGGLEAIQEFFDHATGIEQASFVVIQHLSPEHKSLLVELLGRHTAMQVLEAAHNTPLTAGCVYIIPNDKLIAIEDGRLILLERTQDRGPNMAIDHFLFSLAAYAGPDAFALILSGTGSDGTRGGTAVREEGGVVLVQDPATAKFNGMPLSAIQANIATAVLPPAAMPEAIQHYLHQGGSANGQLFISGTDLSAILGTVYQNTGYDFTQYKPATIMRRISRRIAHTRSDNIASYTRLLAENKEEPQHLARAFFIGVTSFFRDPEAFELLRREVLPLIVQSKEQNESIKIWVTACSTGQEAYTIAILMLEVLKELKSTLPVKIFATDIDERAIEIAARGKYPTDAIQHLPPGIKEAYFTVLDGAATVVPPLRKLVVFAKHNVLKDPPFIKNDLVCCRNLLIYLNAGLQQGVLNTLYFSLRQNAYLLLGPSENPALPGPGFEETNARWKLYCKRGTAGAAPYPNNIRMTHPTPPFEPRSKVQAVSPLPQDFARSLAEDFEFAAVYVDERYEVKEVIGDFRKYLSLPGQLINLNILGMVPIGLSGLLSTALRKVAQEKTKLVFRNTRINIEGTQRNFHLAVHPPAEGTGLMMVVLGTAPGFEPKSNDGQNDTQGQNPYVQELEEELKELRLNLQMAVEGLETTNEELQSANEELQSANEELQSSNEELQSLNEELHTLNTEHQVRIRELKLLNDDLNNYFRSTEIGQVFLDRNLLVRKFNPAATGMINMMESDIGRPISDISTNIRYAALAKDVGTVMETGSALEKEITLNSGALFLLKIIPYVRHDGQHDGAVVSFVDITAIRNLDAIIKGMFETINSGIMVFEAVRQHDAIVDFACTAANAAAIKLTGAKKTSLAGMQLHQDLHSLQQPHLLEKLARVVKTETPLQMEVCLPAGNGLQWFYLTANKLKDGVIVAFGDITSLKQSEENLRSNYNELLRTKESLKQLNAQLEQKITARTRDLSVSEERFRLVAAATNDAIRDWSFTENNIWWSDSFYALFGYDKTDPAVHTAAFWMDNIHPDDRKNVKKEVYGVINTGGLTWKQEYRFRRADGSFAVILDRGTVMHDEWGTPYRMLGAMMDITAAYDTQQEMVRKNDRLESMIKEFTFVTDFMPQMVWATQPDGYHDFFNKQWYRFTGLGYEETKAEGWSLVLHPDDFERTLKKWTYSLQTGEVYEIEYRMRRHDGVYRWFLARALPMQSDDGRILKWFGTCTDIHDQKLANDLLELKVAERTRDLQQSNLELEQSNNELMQFASITSHDLKEPLRKIHIFSTILRDRYHADPGTPAADYLERIIRAASRMMRLINDLLDYSRLSAESFFQPTDLALLMQEVLNDIELAIADKKAIITVANLPVVEAIPGQLRQIFQNLISNALKFSRNGVVPEITITGERISTLSFEGDANPNGRYCRLVVKDNGIGFDNEYAHKIFVIFQRLHDREKYDGTGIGLAIAKKIVERHNGIITARGKEGEGAEFIIVLPLYQS